MVTGLAIVTAAVALIQGVDPDARVHSRWRYPVAGRLPEYARLFREASDPKKKINGYMLRTKRTPAMHGIPGRLVSVTYTLQIRSYQHLIETDTDAAASEEGVRVKSGLIAAAFEDDVTLGLGHSVSHTGVQMPSDMIDVVLGDAGAHRTEYVIEVTAANVNC